MFEHSFKNGHTTKCEYIKPDSNKTQKLTVVYTHGFCSDPYGRKPEEVKKWCIEHGIGFFRWEIAGHGSDIGRFEETTIDTYREQIYEIINNVVDGDIIIGGASLGGWLSLLGAIKYPDRIKGLFGLAAAPDFLKRYVEAYMSPSDKEKLDTVGKVEFPTGDFTYVITKNMIESGYRNMLLDKDEIPFAGKVRLIQGMQDKSLDWRVATIIASKLTSNDVKVVLLKESNHRLSSDEDVKEIHKALSDLCLE